MTRPRTPRPMRRWCAALALVGAATVAVAPAHAADTLKPLDDADLAQVNGRDGLAFNLSGFSIGPIDGHTTTLTYGMPGSTAANPYTLTLTNFTLSRTDDASPFDDPYTLDLVQRNGLADVIRLSFPKNLGLTQLWNFGTELNVTADGASFDLGNFQLRNLGMQGGGLDISTPATPGIQGVAFGLSTKISLEGLFIRPRGAADSSELLAISGVHLHDANTGGAWALSDVTRQPGLFNAVTENGESSLHLQIGWTNDGQPAPTGAVVIDRIAFTTNGVTQDFGSSRIAGIQINYMDVKFRSGP